MKRSETAMLLGYAAATDNRHVDETAVAAWHDLLGDLDVADVREAIRRHYRTSAERIMPAHIRHLTKVIREERARTEAVKALPPGKFEDDPHRAARIERNRAHLRAAMAEIAAKRSVPPADEPELTGSDLIRRRARARARGERRGNVEATR